MTRDSVEVVSYLQVVGGRTTSTSSSVRTLRSGIVVFYSGLPVLARRDGVGVFGPQT